MAQVKNMEGQLCHCGKGKGRDVEEGRVSLLDSPITLGRDINEGSSSDDSYHTPPMAGSSIPPVSSFSSSSEEQALILYDSRDSTLIKIHEEIVENYRPVPIPSPCLDTAGIARLIAVRGQRAVRTLGRPKSTFHPYACCSIGEQCSTHQPGRLCPHRHRVHRRVFWCRKLYRKCHENYKFHQHILSPEKCNGC